jgi:hypothetical protein
MAYSVVVRYCQITSCARWSGGANGVKIGNVGAWVGKRVAKWVVVGGQWRTGPGSASEPLRLPFPLSTNHYSRWSLRLHHITSNYKYIRLKRYASIQEFFCRIGFRMPEKKWIRAVSSCTAATCEIESAPPRNYFPAIKNMSEFGHFRKPLGAFSTPPAVASARQPALFAPSL